MRPMVLYLLALIVVGGLVGGVRSENWFNTDPRRIYAANILSVGAAIVLEVAIRFLVWLGAV